IGGFIGETEYAGLFVKSIGLYGQLILDGVNLEANRGFAIFIKMIAAAQMTFTSVDIRNVWMEGNSFTQVKASLKDPDTPPASLATASVTGHFNPSNPTFSLLFDFTALNSFPTGASIFLNTA